MQQLYAADLDAGAALQRLLGGFCQIDPQIFDAVFVQTAVHNPLGMNTRSFFAGALGAAGLRRIFLNHLLASLIFLKLKRLSPYFMPQSGECETSRSGQTGKSVVKFPQDYLIDCGVRL